MKRLTTLLCCVCFMVAGISLALTNKPPSSYNTLNAAELPVMMQPVKSILPLDLTNNVNDKDTVIVHVHDTVYKPVQKVRAVQSKIRTKKLNIVPDTIPAKVKQDTLYVPALYIIVPLEHLHESNDTLIAKR